MELIKTRDWFFTRNDEPRGYIQPHVLRELWFHTGTACNLACPFCLEGSRPGDRRIQPMQFHDVEPFIDEALELGVERFSFTGGEPFVIRDFVRILAYAADRRPCLVLTNGTAPLLKRMAEVASLSNRGHPVSFRISLDSSDAKAHDAGRGDGSFAKSLEAMRLLVSRGFQVSVARQIHEGENSSAEEQKYRRLFAAERLPDDLPIVAFPDFHPPHAEVETPEITEDCMIRHQTEADRQKFMCAYSKMLVKQDNRMRIYACTLVDDDPGYAFEGSLADSLGARVMLKHHRCYSCFACGASCSEL